MSESLAVLSRCEPHPWGVYRKLCFDRRRSRYKPTSNSLPNAPPRHITTKFPGLTSMYAIVLQRVHGIWEKWPPGPYKFPPKVSSLEQTANIQGRHFRPLAATHHVRYGCRPSRSSFCSLSPLSAFNSPRAMPRDLQG